MIHILLSLVVVGVSLWSGRTRRVWYFWSKMNNQFIRLQHGGMYADETVRKHFKRRGIPAFSTWE